MKEKKYPVSIARHDDFRSSRQVLEGKARKIRNEGKGKVPNRARSLTFDEENILWESGQLGCSNSRSLIQTIWWNNCLHFGMRGREEHYNLKIEHFRLEIDENGRRFVSYTEGLTKTRNQGLNFKPRLIPPKMYESNNERCPVQIFAFFKSKRPVGMRNVGPLYLSVIDAPVTETWYKNQPMGINTINTMLSRMKKKSPLATLCPNKKITNHSARKTTVRKLKSSGFPKCEIKNITGHSSERGLDAYDSGNEDEMFAMSSAICKSLPPKANSYSSSSTRSTISKLPQPSKSLIQVPTFFQGPPQVKFAETLQPGPIDNTNFSFGINWNDNFNLQNPFRSSQGLFSFNACQVNINMNNSNQPQQSKQNKRKPRVIYSDSEESQEY